MKKEIKRFDMTKPPKKMNPLLKPLAHLLSSGDVKKHKVTITKTNMEDIKPPFLLLCNHNAFMDFKVATIALGKIHPNYVVAIDGFIKREGLLRSVGCICKRKFTKDLILVKHLLRVVKSGGVPAIYPEARYSLCGTTAVLPTSMGKLMKLLNVPVVTLICHGHHINSPFFNTNDHLVKGLEAELSLLFTKDEVNDSSIDELNSKLVERFQYDDYKWVKDKGIKVTFDKRAEGLHKVLYQCPDCNTEYEMSSNENILTCNHCHHSWEMLEDCSLKSLNGETSFSHIPDWYEWERSNVRKEIDNGTYSTGKLNVIVRSLPNSKGYITLGKATLIHDLNGFKVESIDKDNHFEMIKDVDSMYSCHIEYNYLNKFGDCIDLNTLDDTWYIYPEGDKFSVTKMALATEELYYKKHPNERN